MKQYPIKSSWFNNFSISTKIISSFTILICVSALTAFFTLVQLKSVVKTSEIVIDEKVPLQQSISEVKNNLNNILQDTQNIMLRDNVDAKAVDNISEHFLITFGFLTKIRYGTDSTQFKDFTNKNPNIANILQDNLNVDINGETKKNIDNILNIYLPKYKHLTYNALDHHKEKTSYIFKVDDTRYSIASFSAKLFADFRRWIGSLEKSVQYNVAFKGELDYTKTLFYRWYQNAKIHDEKIQIIAGKVNGYNKRVHENVISMEKLSGADRQNRFKVQTATDFKRYENELSILSEKTSILFNNLETKEQNAIDNMIKVSENINQELDILQNDLNKDVQNAKLLAHDSSLKASKIITIVIVSSIVGGLLLAYIISRAISKPLINMTNAMKKISEGDINVELDTSIRKDEIGAMTQALIIFKKNKIAGDAMILEREMEGQKALLLSREEAHEQHIILENVNHVVEQCTKGNFSERLQTDNLDPFMKDLADGINKIGETSYHGLSEIKNILNNLSNGNLAARMRGDYQGMFGDIKDMLNKTAEKLDGTIKEIITASHEVKNAASEISISCNDLSSRTEIQVVTLEETSASMEELTETIKQNTKHAIEVSEFAHNAKEIAENGGSVIDNVICSMNMINESSSKISNIINVINDIAFQTNLLALNASIEAARAGEAGKGFSVVASEVRALAGRAGEASEEIQELVTISVSQVRDGSNLVNEAGATLKEIVSAFNQVSNLITEIAAASEQQTVGVERMNKSILSIDENTMQNSAMVEQTSTAAGGLASLGKNLSILIDFFQTSKGNYQSSYDYDDAQERKAG